ncbi:hypothetical protein Aru02nite_64080 [Actinocatenispora rupis]|uniref:Uncharacterized protein n=1 Tax=Actinocatenispora rupis TaxID=519421 RepID=A0A8J3JF34_9ACTN|nr:hypothetical protein Aru02nite_64080 [Actinocatenispora rupis]
MVGLPPWIQADFVRVSWLRPKSLSRNAHRKIHPIPSRNPAIVYRPTVAELIARVLVLGTGTAAPDWPCVAALMVQPPR